MQCNVGCWHQFRFLSFGPLLAFCTAKNRVGLPRLGGHGHGHGVGAVKMEAISCSDDWQHALLMFISSCVFGGN